MAGSSSGFSGPNPTRKHGLSRFSIARFFNISSYTHRTTAQRCPSNFDSDRRSESSSVGLGTGVPIKQTQQSSRDSNRFPLAGPSSSSSESNSFRNVNIESKENSVDGLKKMKEFLECPLCLFELPRQSFPELRSCTHRACYHCLQQYLRIEITESRVNVSCPECTEPIHPSDICMIINDDILLGKYESFMLRRVLITEPDARWCPAPDCGYAVIARGCAGCPKLKCERPGCNTFFCYHCKQEWHPNQTCDAARAQRANNYAPRSSSVSFSQDSIVQTGDDIKPCPCCKVLIIKMDDGSCNHMTCSVCGTEFCWLCMKEISDLHYLSPSGCTFWGKKPWSRKKKIMWQLGMLVGAPVGIALIAGIAVPAIIIGIPVWIGRKLHAKYTRPATGKHSRNLIVTSGVVASVLVSPILAGIAVGIGVPILLAYVYGVVPISLCRSGGCGVSTSASGVRIEFDEEQEIGMGNNQSGVNYDGASVDTTASQRGVNPSIGEISLGMSASLSLGSGSHLDRIALNQDRDNDPENASNVALAGSIASASLMAGAGKLEVQADVSSNKRFSLSSHSETASATVSANMSLADDASMKALAGSILGCRDSSAVTPVEVHVDAQNHDITMESGSRDPTEVSSTFQEYLQLVGSSTEKVDTASAPHLSCSDCMLYPALRLKLSKSCKKRYHSSTVPEVSESESQKAADSISLHCENHCLPSHVHFNEFKECCVSYIDESPSADSLAKPSDSCSDSEEQTKCHFKKSCHAANVPSKLFTPVSDHKLRHETKCVTRSISFCNSCTSNHSSCCPSAFQSGTVPKKNTRFEMSSAVGCSDLNALYNRAYKFPCSLQDVSIDITSDDFESRSSSATKVPASSSSAHFLGAAQNGEMSAMFEKKECHLDINPSNSQPCMKMFKLGKERTYLCSQNEGDSKVENTDTDFEML